MDSDTSLEPSKGDTELPPLELVGWGLLGRTMYSTPRAYTCRYSEVHGRVGAQVRQHV
jgi:hypothetical protein